MITSYKDHYQELGIKPKSSQPQIKEVFRKLSMIYHPDKNENSEKSNQIYRIILNAYKILSDNVKRKEYDEFLKKSEYIKKYGKSDQTYLNGKVSCSNSELLEKINITLWEIDDFIAKNRMDEKSQKYILIILTFLDKWILEPYGFPDYFMEARRLERIDPREYIKTLCDKTLYKGHLPYNNITEYYYDIRKRTDKFITKYEKKATWKESKDQGIGLFDMIIEYDNMAIHYLSYLLNFEEYEGNIIPLYEFSNELYTYDY